MTEPSYAHRKPYRTAASIHPRPRVNPTREQLHNESRIKAAFQSAYQTLAVAFRSDVFAANLPDDDGRWEYVQHYVDSANERAVAEFTNVLVPVGNQGALAGREQVDGWWKRFRKATSPSQLRQAGSVQQPAATVSPLYPGSYPAWVPPRRQLLRTPRRRIDIAPSERTVGHFAGAPQVHLDAIQQLPLDLVTLINDSQINGIRSALDEAIRRGDTPDRLGMIIANMVGLFPRWQGAVTRVEAALVAQGKPAAEVAYRTERYSDWLRERRGIMIARTEMMTALNTGRMAGWEQQSQQGFLDTQLSVKEWLSAPGACDLCADLNGSTVQGVGGTFDAGAFGLVKSGPCHPHCRCTVLLHPVRQPDQFLES